VEGKRVAHSAMLRMVVMKDLCLFMMWVWALVRVFCVSEGSLSDGVTGEGVSGWDCFLFRDRLDVEGA